MEFERFDLEETPDLANVEREVFVLLQETGALRLHDGLLCQAYHVVYDDWQHVGESPNHWMVAIPDDRASERSDASITRARREVDSKVTEPSLSLESYLGVSWSESEWEEYLSERINTAMASKYGSNIFDEMQVPTQLQEQVAWLLTNHPETRGSDKALILEWALTFGGWRKGGSQDGKRIYAIPKTHHWQTTTPESITRVRRRWHQQDLFLPDAQTQAKRKQLEQDVRQAFREGQDPWEVLQ